MKSYKLGVVGIGDMVIFATDVLDSEETDITVTLDRGNIAWYKNDADSYWEFAKSFLSRVLMTKNVTFTDCQDLPPYAIDNGKFLRLSTEEKICNHFKSVFAAQPSSFEFPYITLSTKSRYYARSSFELHKRLLFSEINSLGMKVALLGEKEVEYNPEYAAWGNDQIYSIYADAMENIDPNLLVDCTVPKLGNTTPDVENLFSDMSIAYHSNACINLGVGGFFCMSIFSGKLRAVAPSQIHISSVYLFEDMKGMIESVKTLCGRR